MSLIRLDNKIGSPLGKFSRFMSKLSGGEEGSTLCARAWNYKQKNRSILVNVFVYVLDTFEEDHCKKCAILERRIK